MTIKTNRTESDSSNKTSSGKIIVDIKNVSQEFEVGTEKIQVLKKVDFELQDKTFNIIYGPSGSGKSTLLNILTGLQQPSTGEVVFAGKHLYELSPDELAYFRAVEIGIVYQQNHWVKSLNVVENVALPLWFSGMGRSESLKKASAMLETVNMTGYEKKYPGLLSGGEQQRIATARALINDPLFIIADEPTGSLDSKNGDMIMKLLERCNDEMGRTIILVTHNMEYLPLADHLLHIEDGLVTQTTKHQNIRDVTNDLLDDMKKRINSMQVKKHG